MIQYNGTPLTKSDITDIHFEIVRTTIGTGRYSEDEWHLFFDEIGIPKDEGSTIIGRLHHLEALFTAQENTTEQ